MFKIEKFIHELNPDLDEMYLANMLFKLIILLGFEQYLDEILFDPLYFEINELALCGITLFIIFKGYKKYKSKKYEKTISKS